MTDPATSPDVPDGVLDTDGLLLVDSFEVYAVTGYGDEHRDGAPRVAVALTGVRNRGGTPAAVTVLLEPDRVCDLADAIEAAAIGTLPGRTS